MTYEEQTEKIIKWLISNKVFNSFIYNTRNYRIKYNPFAKEHLDRYLIANSFVWVNTNEGVEFWKGVDNKYKEFYDNYIMKEEKSIKIEVPDGYEIDRENSTLEEIKFKKKEECWRAKEHSCGFANTNNVINGFFIRVDSEISEIKNVTHSIPNRNIFFTKKQAKSALAMAQISQIMTHDLRFGGPVTDEEWQNRYQKKYTIVRLCSGISNEDYCQTYAFLAFHTAQQRDLFLKENADLVKDYLMVD